MIISIIGYKNHSRRLISIIDSLGLCKKLIVFHPNKEKLRKSFNSDQLNCEIVLTDLIDELLDSSCIFITSPTSSHYDYLKKILPIFDGYFFCEKPPCATLKEANSLFSLDSSDKERIYFNFNYRSSMFAKVSLDAIKNNTYGKLISLEFCSTHGLACQSEYQDNWRNKSENILENIVGNVGIHYIDLASYLLNNVKLQSISSLKVSKFSRRSDTFFIGLSSDNCLLSSIYLSYAAPFQNTAKLTFSDGIIELNDGELTIRHPRDTKDDSGMFMRPNKIVLSTFFNSRDYYDNSLTESVASFFKTINNNEYFSVSGFDSSINTTKKILSLTLE